MPSSVPKVLSGERRGLRVQTINDDESLTVQSDRFEADIKHILAKYEATGVLARLPQVALEFRDVQEFTDFATLARRGKEAELEFMQLPSKVREVFDHDWTRWLDAAHDGATDAQRAKLVDLGVLEAVADPTPPAPVDPPPPPPAPEPPPAPPA